MKFHLFGGSQYYPSGGMADYLGAFDRFDEALRKLVGGQMGGGYDWAQIATMNSDGSLGTVWTADKGWVNEDLRVACLGN